MAYKWSKYYPGRAGAILLLILIISMISFPARSQDKSEYDFFDPQTWLLGDISYEYMLARPHNVWFDSEFDAYSFDDDSFLELSKIDLEHINIVIVLGTWCSDSRREVPRFMKIIEALGYNKEKIRFIGVDSYKEAPLDDYEDFDIERVPTFIFYKNNKELGRIIEYPEASLERDMLNILKDK